MAYTATDLRKNIYRILDRVAKTGEVVEVERNGKLLKIVPAEPEDPIKRLQPMVDLIAGDPSDLEHIDWSNEWKP